MSARQRVLVVDDRPFTRSAVVRMLQRNYDVAEAEDGADAIARIKGGETFFAILMDIEMPIVNGMEAFQRISIISPPLAERIYFLTGGAKDPTVTAWLHALDPARVLWKPVSSTDLAAALGRLKPLPEKRPRTSIAPKSLGSRPSSSKMRSAPPVRKSSGKIKVEPSKPKG
ncbi:MAG: response regulator [Polyangiaceae bacterium]